MGYNTLALLVLAVLAGTNATFNSLIPQGKELIYHYHGTMRAGTSLPIAFSSAFVLDGNLHIYTDQKSTFMYFSDLKYKMYNGEYDEWHEFDTKMLPLPKEMEDLYKTFKVMYGDDGMPMGLATGGDEKHFIVNIKKAIATIMQMDWKQVKLESMEHHAFHTKEMTLQGKGKAYYNVMPGKMVVEKMHEPHSTQDMYTHMITNMQETKSCQAEYSEPLTHDDQKIYKLMKKDNDYVIEHIEANGGIYYHPYGGKSEAQHIWMNQTFCLTETKAMTPKEIAGEKMYKDFTYYMTDFETIDGPFPDMSNGRRHWDMDKLIEMTETMMHDMMDYMNEDQIKTDMPDKKHTHLINRMKRNMLYLDIAHLEKMHAKLLTKTGEKDKQYLQIFYELLPMIGTHASMNYIKTLIMDKKIKDRVAVKMLEKMPFYVQFPNKKMMDDMSIMLTWEGKVERSVRNAAILSYATLIHEALERYNLYKHKYTWEGFEHDHDFMPEMDTEKMMFPDEKYYEKYIVEFVTKLKEAKDDDTKIVYMYAMYNTKMMSILHHLTPFVKGKIWDDKFMMMVAAISISPAVLHSEDLAYEMYWPIMSCTKMPTAYRIMGYYLLMVSQPSQQRLMNIYWHMMNVENHALYQFHYRYMEAMIKTTDPCKQTFKMHLKQIMRYSQKPQEHGMTGFYQMDYTDSFGYGQALQYLYVNTPNEADTLFKFTMQNQWENTLYTPYNILIRISGMSDKLGDDFKLDIKSLDKMYNWNQLWKIYTSIMDNKDFELNIMIMNYDQMVMVYNYDHTNIKSMWDNLMHINDNKIIRKYISIHYPFATTIVLPTPMGFPAAYQEYMPTVYYCDFDMSWETINNVHTLHIDNHWKSMSHGRIGLSVYNPIVDMWQGVAKLYVMDTVLPMFMDLSFNPQQQSMKISWKRHSETVKDVIGLRTHVETDVFVIDDMEHDILKQSCPECHKMEVASLGEDFRHEKEIVDEDCYHTGYNYHIKAFDSERYNLNSTMEIMLGLMKYDSMKNYKTPLGYFIISKLNLMSYLHMQPVPASNGWLFRYETSKAYPLTNIDMTFRINREYKQKDWHLMPAAKYNMRATYSTKIGEKVMKTWDANLLMDYNLGHTSNTMKLYFTRIIPGQKDYKICMDGWMKWKDEMMNAQMNLGTTQATEGKCTKDDQIFEMSLLAEKLPQQMDGKHMYKECSEYLWSDIHEEQSMKCYAAYNTLRKYTYDIKTKDMPTEFKNTMWTFMELLKGYYMPYYTYVHEPTLKMEDNTYKIILEYPMIENVVDFHMMTPQHEYMYSGIPMRRWYLSMIHPYNTQYSPMMKIMHNAGLMKKCYLEQEMLDNVMDMPLDFKMPAEWTMYFGDAAADSKHALWAKKIEGTDKIAMKVMHQTHSLEIIPNGMMYDIMVDGKKIDTTSTMSHTEDWFHMDYIKKTEVVAMVMHHMGSYMVYDGHHMYMEFPLADVHYYGHCFDEVKQE